MLTLLLLLSTALALEPDTEPRYGRAYSTIEPQAEAPRFLDVEERCFSRMHSFGNLPDRVSTSAGDYPCPVLPRRWSATLVHPTALNIPDALPITKDTPPSTRKHGRIHRNWSQPPARSTRELVERVPGVTVHRGYAAYRGVPMEQFIDGIWVPQPTAPRLVGSTPTMPRGSMHHR